MKTWVTMLLLLLSASLTACNTVSGAGHDVQPVEDVAEKIKEKLKDNDDE